jgi:hypothetical protein
MGAIAIAATFYLAHRIGTERVTQRKWLQRLGAALVVGPLVTATWTLLPTFDREIVKHPPAILRGVGPSRIAHPLRHETRPLDPLPAQARTLYEGAAPNVAAPFGFSYVVGYDQAHSARFEHWRPLLVAAGRLAYDLYGVAYVIAHTDETHAQIAGTDAPFGPNVLFENADRRPRAFVTTRWKWTAEDTLPGALLTSRHEPISTVLLSGEGAPTSDGVGELSPCELVSSVPERVRMSCTAPRAGYAVLLDSWSPGWSVNVDGKPARIERADALVRAVAVTSGPHMIELTYETPGLRGGALVSALAWLAALTSLGLLGRRSSIRATLEVPDTTLEPGS